MAHVTIAERVFITGGAGFVGSSIADRFLERGAQVVAYDNLSTGQERFLEQAAVNPRFSLVRGDVLDLEALKSAMRGCDLVFHMSANADVRNGLKDPRRDFEQNALGTSNVLEAMRSNGVRRIAFASTGSIYGDSAVQPTPEDAPFPIQTSLYGASKLAGEGLIAAYSEGYQFQAWVFRFVSLLGERYSHGHIFDFYRRLREDPKHLHVLGDGRQRKSYVYVQDCIDGIVLALEKSSARFNLFNVGTDGYCTVKDSIGWITAELGLQPELTYEGGDRGWVGDSPYIFLSCARLRGLGWAPRLTIREGIVKTVQYLRANPWLLERR